MECTIPDTHITQTAADRRALIPDLEDGLARLDAPAAMSSPPETLLRLPHNSGADALLLHAVRLGLVLQDQVQDEGGRNGGQQDGEKLQEREK